MLHFTPVSGNNHNFEKPVIVSRCPLIIGMRDIDNRDYAKPPLSLVIIFEIVDVDTPNRRRPPLKYSGIKSSPLFDASLLFGPHNDMMQCSGCIQPRLPWHFFQTSSFFFQIAIDSNRSPRLVTLVNNVPHPVLGKIKGSD